MEHADAGERDLSDDNPARAARRARGLRLRSFAASIGLGPVTQAMREQGAAPIGPLSRGLYLLIVACELAGHRALVNQALAYPRPREDRSFFRLLGEVLKQGEFELLSRALAEDGSPELSPGLSDAAEELRARIAPIARELEAWSVRVEDRAARQLETAAARAEESVYYLGLAERSLRRAAEQDLVSTTRLPSAAVEIPRLHSDTLLADLLLGAERADFDETPGLLSELSRLEPSAFAERHGGPFLLGLVTPSRDNPLLYTRGKHDALTTAASAFLVEARRVGEEIAIGRGEACDVVLPVASLAERQALLLRRDGGWGLVDVGEGPGITLAGRTILPGEEVPLAEGEMVRLGNDVQVRLLTADQARAILRYLEQYENP